MKNAIHEAITIAFIIIALALISVTWIVTDTDYAIAKLEHNLEHDKLVLEMKETDLAILVERRLERESVAEWTKKRRD